MDVWLFSNKLLQLLLCCLLVHLPAIAASKEEFESPKNGLLHPAGKTLEAAGDVKAEQPEPEPELYEESPEVEEEEVPAELGDELFDYDFIKRPDEDREKETGDCYWEMHDRVPYQCRCIQRKLYCDNRNLEVVPPQLPQETLYLDLSGNEITDLSNQSFAGLTHLQTLIVNNGQSGYKVKRVKADAFTSLSSLESLSLLGNAIHVLHNNTFSSLANLEKINLRYNKISELSVGAFRKLDSLTVLDLRDNQISRLKPGTFSGLHSLRILFLDNNNIGEVRSHVFYQMSHLTDLYLRNNKIARIERNSLNEISSLRALYLSQNRIKRIQSGTFSDQNGLEKLYLGNNMIEDIEKGSFRQLGNLLLLHLQGNPLRTLNSELLRPLKNLTHVYFEKWYQCRYAPPSVRVCEPEGDGISSFRNLLDNLVLRTSVWVVAVLGCIGNALVLVGRLLIKEDNRVHSFFIKNLSLADLFMGIYLFIIAFYDVRFRGNFINFEETWRTSWQCNLCGFLSTVSSEVSVLTLTIITADRFFSISYPLSLQKRNLKLASSFMLFLWLACIVMAALPVVNLAYFGREFYRNNGVCLPLHIHDPYAEGWEYSAFMFLGVNLVSFAFIVFAYVRMFLVIRNSKVGVRSTQENQDRAIAKRFAFIVSTDFICWMPIIVIKTMALAGVPIDNHLYAWVAIFILPVNSALNPILYTLTTKLFKQQMSRLCKMLQRGGLHSLYDTDSSGTRSPANPRIVKQPSTTSSVLQACNGEVTCKLLNGNGPSQKNACV